MKTPSVLVLSLISSAITLTTFSASAQRDNRHESDVVQVINSDTADANRVEKHLKENAPQAPNDNGLPRFAVVGKDNKFYLGIGAQFLGEGVVDFGDRMPSALDFTPASMLPASRGNRSNLGFAWQSSGIYFNFVSLPGTENQLGLFFKASFRPDNNIKVSHLYAKYRGLTVGYTNSLFTDGAAEPMTIDNEGPNGMASLSLFTAYWTQAFTPNFSGAIGIDAPSTDYTTSKTATTVNQRIPAIPLYLQYGWDGGNSHVRLSGLIRPMQYRNMSAEKNKTLTGLGLQLSGMTPVVGGLTFSYSAVYGRGIGTYLQDDNGLGIDAVPSRSGSSLVMPRNLGITAGLNYTFSHKVAANLVYSHLTNWLPGDAAADPAQYRYGDYLAANVIYTINKFLSAGIEYDYGYRRTFAGDPLHSNRVQVQFGLTF